VQKTAHTNSSELKRGLGLWASIAVIVGAMVGHSIFLVTSQIAHDVGSVGRILAAWLIGGAIVLLATFCYAEFGAAIPEAGGEYVYVGRVFGPMCGFLFGWGSAWISGPGMAATIAAGLLRITAFLLPSLRSPIFIWNFSVPFRSQPYHFIFTAAQMWAAVAIAAVATINYFGVRTAGRFQILITGLKVAAIVLIIVVGLTVKTTGGMLAAMGNAGPAYRSVSAFLAALVPVMLAYNGFQTLGHVGGEIADPQRTIPRAAIVGVLTVVFLYVLINVVYLRVLSLSIISTSQNVASDAAVKIAGASGARWLTIVMILSALGSLHVNFLGRARIPYAMARDGHFFSFAKRVQPTFHTPSGALYFHGCLAVILVLTGTFEEIYSSEIFVIWIFLALTAVGLIRLRKKEPALPRPYRAWGYPWAPLIVAVVAFAISANLWLMRPIRSSIGLAVILLGIPFFRWSQNRASSSPLVEAAPSGSLPSAKCSRSSPDLPRG
jgi:APA family basic amino acid/polyamine antiporter